VTARDASSDSANVSEFRRSSSPLPFREGGAGGVDSSVIIAVGYRVRGVGFQVLRAGRVALLAVEGVPGDLLEVGGLACG